MAPFFAYAQPHAELLCHHFHLLYRNVCEEEGVRKIPYSWRNICICGAGYFANVMHRGYLVDLLDDRVAHSPWFRRYM